MRNGDCSLSASSAESVRVSSLGRRPGPGHLVIQTEIAARAVAEVNEASEKERPCCFEGPKALNAKGLC